MNIVIYVVEKFTFVMGQKVEWLKHISTKSIHHIYLHWFTVTHTVVQQEY